MNNNENINFYMTLIRALHTSPTDANLEALESFEDNHPYIWNDAYHAAGDDAGMIVELKLANDNWD